MGAVGYTRRRARERLTLGVLLVAATFVTATAGAQPAIHPASDGGDAGCPRCHAAIVTRPVLHGPIAAGSCSSCHELDAARGRMSLVGGATVTKVAGLCVRCHDAIATRLKDTHVHAPVTLGDCNVCHDPHGSAFPFQLRGKPRDACLTCHEDVAVAVAESYPHAPAAISCTLCHDAHASPFRAHTRSALNTLCLTCHLKTAVAEVGDPDQHERSWLSAAELATIGEGKQIALAPDLTRGHPSQPHPVAGRPDPSEHNRPLTCVSCHNPHGARTKALLRFSTTGVSGLCIKCHQL